MSANKGITLERLAEELGGELKGAKPNLTVTNIRDIEEAGVGDLAFVLREKNEPLLQKTKATCAIVPLTIEESPIPIIKCKNANLALRKSIELVLPGHIPHPKGIHKTAVIGSNVKLGKDVALGAYAVIEDNVEIGDNTVIYAHSYVGKRSKIGANSIIYANVSIRENVKIGNRVIINPGCIIGGDGFGYELTPRGHAKIPHIGDVVIEDDVELGASVTVDRAKIAHTTIGRGTKVDNLVQIAHNVTIGQNCIIVAHCGIGGSTKIGNNVMLGGQVGVTDHVVIGDNAMVGAQSGVMKSVPPNSIVWGIPARPIKKQKIIHILSNKLPEVFERLKHLEKKLGIK